MYILYHTRPRTRAGVSRERRERIWYNISIETDNYVLRFEDVAISRGDKLIWSEGSFALKRGTITAVIGPNGAGKTTLAQLILGTLKPSRGKIQINQDDIGYVSQHYAISGGYALRGVDLIRLNLNGARLGIRKVDESAVRKAIEAVGASDFAQKRFAHLSGGQQQRIAIGAAIVSQPQMLILDEPLSSLDMESARDICQLLKTLNEKLGISIIIIAHDLGLLLPILTGAIYLVDGHAHYGDLDDAEHEDYSDLIKHLTTLKVGDHELS